MHHDHGQRHARRRGQIFIAWQSGAQVRAQQKAGHAGVDEHGHRRLPAEGGEHEGAVPLPGAGHHQHWGRGVGGQRATDGDVHKQHTQRQVLQSFGDMGTKDLRAQHQGRNRHGSRLGDQ